MTNAVHRKKVWITVAVGATVILLVAGTWVAAMAFVSPQQRAAAASAPAAQPITTTVTRGDLTDIRTLPAEITVASSHSMPILGQPGQTRTVVTSVKKEPSATVGEGDVLVETNGAPVFILTAEFPFYRDLGVGDHGPDVQALQEGLVRLGLLPAADGTFGTETAKAIARLYTGAGYAAPTRPADEATHPTTPATSGGTGPEDASSTPPRKVSTYLPLSAVVTTPNLPAIVEKTPPVGTVVTDSTAVTLGSRAAIITATVPDSMLSAMKPGLDAQIVMPDGALVPAVTDQVQTVTKDDGAQTTLTVTRSDREPIDPALIGRPASIQVTLSTVAKDALVVPMIAVSKHRDGTAVVLVKSKGGSFVETPVKVIATLGGSAAIETGDRLSAGDEVRVG